MNFQKKLKRAINKNKSLLCVGLDPVKPRISEKFQKKQEGLFLFNKYIIDQTYDLVCSYKPNIAFYEAEGADGINQLKITIEYIKNNYPLIPIILDAKRGDIGHTNEAYCQYVFDYLNADAVTLHPYLGEEALAPFLKRKDKGCIILCRTSNPGGGEFQDLIVNKQPLYKIVAKNVISSWNKNNNCLLVVGATYPQELKEVRKIVGEMFILVPGIGAQGGNLETVLKNGLTKEKTGLIISQSRSIIYAPNPREAAKKQVKVIRKYL